MPEYYVNRNPQSNGDHEVHRADNCPVPAAIINRHYLGWYISCHGAVAEARRQGFRANGCYFCSRECHTG
ncbi:MAG: hypothetical protein OXE76_07415 [Alphaproteobacteria bacterium]|nr:hypothetical protein [Alphaproteobacteria bacterium]